MKNFDSVERFLKKIRIPYKVIFLITGLLTTVWFLVRVIPKPSRAAYPCMRAAAPVMSGFVLYLLSISASAFAFKKAKKHFGKAKYMTAALCLAVAVGAAFTVNFINVKPSSAGQPSANATNFPANQPMGEGKGIFPGRVVWAHDKNATDETVVDYSKGTYFFTEGAIDQYTVSSMLRQTVKTLAGQEDLKAAWDALFEYHNQKKGNGKKTYNINDEEKIFIKINQGCGSWLKNGGAWPNDASTVANSNQSKGATEATPQVVLELLHQLVDVCGVPQYCIYIGDPGSYLFQHNYSLWSAHYPDVMYIGKTNSGPNDEIQGVFTSEEDLNYSDEGKILGDAKGCLFYEITEASYVINVANLKLHIRNGISLTAKNHFGTRRESANATGADKLHPSTLQGDIAQSNLGWGKYRVLVDIMGNEYLGGNTMLFLVDGLFGGGANETRRPVKYFSAPFNNDWANSIFASQDEVALESVCQDILREEWNGQRTHSSDNNQNENSAWWSGVDDHLHQAADPANWPLTVGGEPFAGYYPNAYSDEPIGSLGVHEHWNNATEKKYSRNLGGNEGIELVQIGGEAESATEYTAYKVKSSSAPVIDGVADLVWNETPWYAIDQIWYPYNNNPSTPGTQMSGGKVVNGPSDFSGRFKMLWSEEENVIYFLAEVKDDVRVDNYTCGNSGYPDFDILEIFIDENKSGGRHVWNDTSTGELAANAFSYHLAAKLSNLNDDEEQNDLCAMDIKGANKNDWSIINYADHFPAFSARKNGTTVVYEFALKIYSDQYDVNDDAEGNAGKIVTLADNKQLGLALAYCDNDTPGGTREHFIGSVPLPANANNSCWENADRYGALTLSPTYVSSIDIEDVYQQPEVEKIASIYPNPAAGYINLAIDGSYTGMVQADLYSIDGKLVSILYRGEASPNLQLSLNGVQAGNYICVIKAGRKTESIRLIVK